MAKLKIGVPNDDKPIKVALELPASAHRDLVAYVDFLACDSGQSIGDPVKLIAPMLARFMATDRGFTRYRRHNQIELADKG
jgi:hypothetical protein